MITLYQFLPRSKRPDPSPFCAKVDTFLRIHNIPAEGKTGNPQAGPKGKLPFIVMDGQKISDSEEIIRSLCSKHGIDPEADLTNTQKTESFFIRKSLEESFYFLIMYGRWIEPRGWAVFKKHIFGKLPLPLSIIIPKIVLRTVRKQLYYQGTGRHSADEIERRGVDFVEHLATLLGEQSYVFGKKPSLIDCVVFPFLYNASLLPPENLMNKACARHPQVGAYLNRMLKNYYEKA